MGETKNKLKRKTEESIVFEYDFNESLNYDILKTVLCELLKHIMYMRYQIPMPFSILLSENLKEKQNKEKHSIMPAAPLRGKLLKKSRFMENMVTICDSLENIIRTGKLKKIVILFGSTVVSPKETIVINLKNIDYSSTDDGNAKSLSRKVLRNVVTDERFTTLPNISKKNIFILICLDNVILEECDSNVFLPKLSYKLSNRGSYHYFNFSSELLEPTSDVLIDGISSLNINDEKDEVEHWYISNLPLHGFREAISKQNGTSWM